MYIQACIHTSTYLYIFMYHYVKLSSILVYHLLLAMHVWKVGTNLEIGCSPCSFAFFCMLGRTGDFASEIWFPFHDDLHPAVSLCALLEM